jgi:hypothetical protein
MSALVCSRCAKTDAVHNSKRLENLTWRIYSQQTLSRSPERLAATYPVSERNLSSESVPGLSTSPGSPTCSDADMGTPPDVEMSYFGTMDSPKVISPVTLETMVKSVTENDTLEPLGHLPTPLFSTSHPIMHSESQLRVPATIPEQSQVEPIQVKSLHRDVESSTSTMATNPMESDFLDGGYLAPTESTSSDLSSTSIVRGFSKDQISSSRRSRTQLAPPQPILKQSSPQSRANPLIKPTKKKTTFMIGASSEGDDASSYDSPQQRSSLTAGLQSYTNSLDANHSESAIEDDDDDEEEEEEDDDGDWEEVDDASQQEDMFQRVESSTNLRSRPSLLTNMLHEQDRAKALQNAASRSSPAIRRSRTPSHNGPLGTSPHEAQPQLTRTRAIPTFDAQQSSETMPIALSPRTNRRNMLSTELTGSLRKHLLWERQQRNPGNKTLKNRQYRSEIRLTDHVAQASGSTQEPLRRNDTANFYDNGLQEYFEKGW